jgi:hypothetical protein
VIDLTTFGFSGGTGVTLSPHADSFYFIADIDALVNVGLTGTLISSQAIGSTDIEGIAVVETPSCDIFARNAQITTNTFSFDIYGFAGTNWTVYDSSDLTNWTPSGSVTLGSSGTGSFTDTNITGVPYRFYKLSDSNCCSQAIGFVRIQVGAGPTNSPGTNSLLANQLDSANGNTLDGLFNVNGSGAMPDGTPLMNGAEIIKWDVSSQAFLYYTWNSGTGWLDGSGNPAGNVTLNPGEGAFLATTNAVMVTFVGLVRDGNLSMFVGPSNFYLVSAMVPKFGGLQTGLAYMTHAGDQVQIWNGNGTGYTVYSYLRFNGGGWNPREPVINVGQSFFLKSSTNNTWQINFSDCP